MIKIIALVFHFVLVCSDEHGCSESLPYGSTKFDGWVDKGPYFTIEDCEEAQHESIQAPLYWSENLMSECYANAVIWKGDQS